MSVHLVPSKQMTTPGDFPSATDNLNFIIALGTVASIFRWIDADIAIYVSSNVSVEVDSAQRSIHLVDETWKTPKQAWINTTIRAQAWKKAL